MFAHANTSSVTSSSVAPPPPGFSDIPYQDGVVGEQFRLRTAAGTGTYADVPPQRGRGAAATGQAGGRGAARAAERLRLLRAGRRRPPRPRTRRSRQEGVAAVAEAERVAAD